MDEVFQRLGFRVTVKDVEFRAGPEGSVFKHHWKRRPKVDTFSQGGNGNTLSPDQDEMLMWYLGEEKANIARRRVGQCVVAREASDFLGFFITQGNIAHRMGTADNAVIQFEWPGSASAKKARASGVNQDVFREALLALQAYENWGAAARKALIVAGINIPPCPVLAPRIIERFDQASLEDAEMDKREPEETGAIKLEPLASVA